MENHASNPAGRLWLYFSVFDALPPTQPIYKGARTYFGVADKYTEKYMSAVASLMRLPGEAMSMLRQVEASPIPMSKLLRPLPLAAGVFSADPLGAQNVQWLKSQIDPGVMSDLETTSHVLGSYVARMQDIETDTLDRIRLLAEEIVTLATADESLDAEARAAIVRHAHRIVVAADLYKITGPQALIDELDRFYSTQKRIQPTPSKPLKQKIGALVGAIVIAVELFGAPANMDNAIEYYGEVFELTAITEAPSQGDDDTIVIAEIVSDEGGVTA